MDVEEAYEEMLQQERQQMALQKTSLAQLQLVHRLMNPALGSYHVELKANLQTWHHRLCHPRDFLLTEHSKLKWVAHRYIPRYEINLM